MTNVWNRIKAEPALVGAAVVAVGALFGADLVEESGTITAGLALLVGWLVRRKVVPLVKFEAAPEQDKAA
jgi:hypothetical protein